MKIRLGNLCVLQSGPADDDLLSAHKDRPPQERRIVDHRRNRLPLRRRLLVPAGALEGSGTGADEVCDRTIANQFVQFTLGEGLFEEITFDDFELSAAQEPSCVKAGASRELPVELERFACHRSEIETLKI